MAQVAASSEEVPVNFPVVEPDTFEELIMKSIETKEMQEEYTDYGYYDTVRRAVEDEDWNVVKKFIEDNPEALTAMLSDSFQTILHCIIRSENTIEFVKELVAKMPEKALELSDVWGMTALSDCATYGNTEAAKIMVRKNHKLPNIPDLMDLLPLHHAAMFGHKEMVYFLLSVTALNEDPSPLSGESGVRLVENLISANLYGVALDLLERYPMLAREQLEHRTKVLNRLAGKPLGFASGSQLGYWEHLISTCIPDDCSLPDVRGGDMEDPKKCSKLQQTFASCGATRKKLHIMLYNTIKRLVPCIKRIHDTKLMHKQTCELVKLMCEGMTWTFKDALSSLKRPILTAARLGIQEIVQEIIKAHSFSPAFLDHDGHNMFQLAVLHRQEKVFSLIYKMGLRKIGTASFRDNTGNNILHLAGRLVPSSQVSGAALQMQRELQWYKVVENLVHPSLQEQENYDKLTPREVFTKEHIELVKAGQEWINDSATSCSVVGALIITIAFAAAISVPGSNADNGEPNYLNEKSFKIFAISNALALFSSTTSVLMFLGMLTSRYSELDFLVSLPRKMMIGLITLFISIAAMMIAFSATLHLLVFHPLKWVFSPVVLLACVPVTLYALLQFRLLVKVFLSTYGPSFIQSN